VDKEAPGFRPCLRVARDQRAVMRGPSRVINRAFSSLHLTLSASSTRTSERPRSMPDPRDYIFFPWKKLVEEEAAADSAAEEEAAATAPVAMQCSLALVTSP